MGHPVKLFCFLVPSAINHERTKREERDWTDDAEDYAQDVLDQSWGGKCIQASDCLDYVAYCHKDADIGTILRTGIWLESKGGKGQDTRWKNHFLVSFVSKDTDIHTKDTFCGSIDTEPAYWFWLADPHFRYRAPTLAVFGKDLLLSTKLSTPNYM